jgi:hypothetical protein
LSLKSHGDADVQTSIVYGKRVKFYPLSEIDNPPDTIFVDVKDKDFDSTIKYDASFSRCSTASSKPSPGSPATGR